MNALSPASYPATRGDRETQLLARIAVLERDIAKANDANAALRDSLARLEAALTGSSGDFIKLRAIGLMPREAALAAALLKHDALTREGALAAIFAGRPDTKSDYSSNIPVAYISTTRKRLRPLGIAIDNVQRLGWRLSPDDKAKLRAILAAAD